MDRKQRIRCFYESEMLNTKYVNEGIKSKIHVQSKWESNVPNSTKFTSLGHEMAHSYDRLEGTFDSDSWLTINGTTGPEQILEAEKYSTYIENGIRSEHGIPLREFYSYGTDGPNTDTRIVTGRHCLYVGANKQVKKVYIILPKQKTI